MSSSEGGWGGLAQEKTSDPLLDSTLSCSKEGFQGECACVCVVERGSLPYCLNVIKICAQPGSIGNVCEMGLRGVRHNIR